VSAAVPSVDFPVINGNEVVVTGKDEYGFLNVVEI
jgi:hypothetical protein